MATLESRWKTPKAISRDTCLDIAVSFFDGYQAVIYLPHTSMHCFPYAIVVSTKILLKVGFVRSEVTLPELQHLRWDISYDNVWRVNYAPDLMFT